VKTQKSICERRFRVNNGLLRYAGERACESIDPVFAARVEDGADTVVQGFESESQGG